MFLSRGHCFFFTVDACTSVRSQKLTFCKAATWPGPEICQLTGNEYKENVLYLYCVTALSLFFVQWITPI
jgi:hypothetical protein